MVQRVQTTWNFAQHWNQAIPAYLQHYMRALYLNYFSRTARTTTRLLGLTKRNINNFFSTKKRANSHASQALSS